jgi:hypothetical protein
MTCLGNGAVCGMGDGSPGELRGTGLCDVHFCAPRITCPPGTMIEAGDYDFSGGSETDYAWYVFLRGFHGPWTGHPLHTPGPNSHSRKR